MVLLIACFLLLQLYTDTQCSDCPPSGWGCGATACFYIYTCHNSFSGATQACTQQGLTLASVASDQERQFLWDVIDSVAPSDNLFWLGGMRESISDEFSWLDGSPFPFTNETSKLSDLCLRYRGITYNDFESNKCDLWHQYVCRNGTGDMPPANTTTTATTTQMTSMMTTDSTSTTPTTSVATATTTTTPMTSMSTTATTTTAETASMTTATTTGSPAETTTVATTTTTAETASMTTTTTTGSPIETTTAATTNNPVTTETSPTTATQQITTLTQPTSTQTTILTTSKAQPTTHPTTTLAQPPSGTQPTTQSTTLAQPTSGTQPTSVDQWTTVTWNTTMEDPASSTEETTSANTMTSNPNVTTAESSPLGYSPQDVSREITSTEFGEIPNSGTNARNTATSSGASGVIWGTSVSETPTSDNVINGSVQSSNQSPGNQETEPTIAPTSISAPNASAYQSTVVSRCECCAAWREFLNRNLTSGTFRLDDLLVYKKKKLHTVDDTRISARSIGGSAVSLLVISFLTIVVLDAGKLFHDFRRMYKHLREAFRPQNVIDIQTNRVDDA